MSAGAGRPTHGPRPRATAPLEGAAEKPGRAARRRTGRVGRTDRTDHADRGGQPDRADRPERADRPDRGGRTDRVGPAGRRERPASTTPEPPADLLELEIGPVAHRGLCVARAGGRVIFVRHALPGERVRARVTDVSHDRYWRADAVEILTASPDRVPPPCPHARPGGCGGCDWQHATPAAQRRLKAQVVAESLRRLARLEVAVDVEELLADRADGLGWRTRMRFSRTPDGGVGLRAHRSHEVVPTPDCLIAHPLIARVIADRGFLTGPASPERTGQAIEFVAMPAPGPPRGAPGEPPGGSVAYSMRSGRWRTADVEPGRVGPGGVEPGQSGPVAGAGPVEVVETVAGREFRMEPGVFWQVHPSAASTLVAAVREAAAAAPGETAVDLYSGAGLFAAFLAVDVGPAGRVIALESDEAAVRAAARSLPDLPWVSLRSLRVTPATVRGLTGTRGGVDVAVLDPPRTGAGVEVMAELLAHAPRRVVYVACDPAALARDVAIAAREGYQLTALRAFDLFPMTSHVECVATLEPAPAGAGGTGIAAPAGPVARG